MNNSEFHPRTVRLGRAVRNPKQGSGGAWNSRRLRFQKKYNLFFTYKFQEIQKSKKFFCAAEPTATCCCMEDLCNGNLTSFMVFSTR